jgi:hypothetical protein
MSDAAFAPFELNACLSSLMRSSSFDKPKPR